MIVTYRKYLAPNKPGKVYVDRDTTMSLLDYMRMMAKDDPDMVVDLINVTCINDDEDAFIPGFPRRID
jgi:hypothetical protein